MRFAVIAFAVLLAGCREEPRQRPPAPSLTDQVVEARRAAEERLRTRLRITGDMRLRAVAVHPQAISGTFAVCGQINPSGRSEDPFIPFVARVTFEGERPVRTDLVLGASNAEASRVFVELLDRCFDGGGPTNTRQMARPVPPLPTEMPRVFAGGTSQTVPPPAPAPAALPPIMQAASGNVMTTSRHPVNIRSNPQGGADVLRVVPRGSNLQVFGQAPGGWLQVGESEPWGWLHSSLLDAR